MSDQPKETFEQHEAVPGADAREPSNSQITVSRDSITLSGAQLLEALEFIAPDRDAEQLESEVTIERGTGHTGDGMYCWSTEYPEEGAILLDGTAIAQPEPAVADEQSALPRYTEWMHLRTHGVWSDGVPSWARDHAGHMNDLTAAIAVIEELAARASSPNAAEAEDTWRGLYEAAMNDLSPAFDYVQSHADQFGALLGDSKLKIIAEWFPRLAAPAQAAEPVCWITKEQLEQLEDLTSDAWVYWRETGHVAEDDELALYTAPPPRGRALCKCRGFGPCEQRTDGSCRLRKDVAPASAPVGLTDEATDCGCATNEACQMKTDGSCWRAD